MQKPEGAVEAEDAVRVVVRVIEKQTVNVRVGAEDRSQPVCGTSGAQPIASDFETHKHQYSFLVNKKRQAMKTLIGVFC